MIYAILLALSIATFFLGIAAGMQLEREKWTMRSRIESELEIARRDDP